MSGCSKISACSDGPEVHSDETATLKVYIPAGRSFIIALDPDPSAVIPPGLTVTIHSELEGNPLNSTLPVEDVHVG